MPRKVGLPKIPYPHCKVKLTENYSKYFDVHIRNAECVLKLKPEEV